MKTRDETRILNLSSLSLSSEDVELLVSISLSPISLVQHDASSYLAILIGTLYSLANPESKQQDTGDAGGPTNRSQLAREQMRGLQRALDSLSQYGGPEGRISTFISKPSAVLEEVRHRNPKANVLLSDEADQSLEILFPENVLGGLLTELVNNAVKFSRKDSPTVCVNWHMQDNRFICCIDDDGTDPPISPHEKHIPLDLLLKSDTYSDEKPHGLRIVNRVIRLAKGLMLFSRAPILGGLRVLLDIPVLAHRTGAQ